MTPGEQLRQRLNDQYERNGYEPDGRELELIDRACVVADVCSALERVVERDGPVTPEGRVQPALQELRQQHLVLLRLVSALDFGADEEGHATTRATKGARAAANARWSKADRPTRKAV